jgi:tRNA G10  N-methylase Trm11
MIDRITEQPFCQTRVSGSTFVNADCFDVFPFIEDKSIDAIICDLPYGTTAVNGIVYYLLTNFGSNMKGL